MNRRRAVVLATTLAMITLAVPAPAAVEKVEVIVVLESPDKPVRQFAQAMADANGGDVGFVYTTALEGFTLTVPAPAIHSIARNPHVAYVEPVQAVAAVGTQPVPTGIDRIEADVNPPGQPLDVDIAILDTGVYIGQRADGSARSHLDLNLQWVSDCTGAIFYPLFGGCSGQGDFQDYHGHGTHVAGIAAAWDNDIGTIGVAPGAVLHSFKVLQADGTGTTGMILAGIDAVASKADVIEVANMSLGFVGSSQAIDDAIAAATDVGVVFVVAAGNDSIDASQFSPANSPDAIAVSAVADFDGLAGGLGSPTCRADQDDTLADFSNFGSTVEIAAPGVCIYSTDLDDGYSVKSGTSMASPFVAGAIARYIAESGHPTDDRADVTAIKAAVLGAAVPQSSTCGFQDVDNSPEPMLFMNAGAFGGDGTCGGAPPPPPTNNPPLADFDGNCTGLTCDFTNNSSDPDGDPITHTWDFGDGTESSEESPSHTYAEAGTYTVTLTVSDGTDETEATETFTVAEPSVNQPPVAAFTSSCTHLDCTFTNGSSDPDPDANLTYQWAFGDGGTSTAEHPTHSYANAGSYTVTLIVSDGDLSDSTIETVTVSEPPPVDLLVSGVVNPIITNGRDVEVAVAVWDQNGDYLGGATVEGTLTYTDRRGRTRTTNLSGVSEADDIGYGGFISNLLLTKRLPRGATAQSFCIDDITAPGYTYVLTGWECYPWGS